MIDRWLDVSTLPVASDAIVCLGAGTDLPNLPNAAGWERIYTATQVFADGYAPVVVFAGRGSSLLSEAEAYADAAMWLGMPRDAILNDPRPDRTAEHPSSLLNLEGGRFTRRSRVLVVTSPTHSRRALLTFRKQGFTDVRIVSGYRSPHTSGQTARQRKVSAIAGFQPSSRSYDNVFSRLRDCSTALLTSLQELTAISWYWWKGWI